VRAKGGTALSPDRAAGPREGKGGIVSYRTRGTIWSWGAERRGGRKLRQGGPSLASDRGS